MMDEHDYVFMGDLHYGHSQYEESLTKALKEAEKRQQKRKLYGDRYRKLKEQLIKDLKACKRSKTI